MAGRQYVTFVGWSGSAWGGQGDFNFELLGEPDGTKLIGLYGP